ncbi:MAG: radical SAM protein [Methanomicrobiales archaeon]|nr:radical SAM protein [Methanomicrobiales archaeon]
MDPPRYPAYRQLQAEGRLQERVDQAIALLEECRVCPRHCGVNRLQDELGYCRTGRRAVVSSSGPHYGEEPPLVGRRGSGTIFFTHCNLRCAFCQNYEISQGGEGVEVDAGRLAGIMLSLQELGCHNLNFVTPTHVVPQILEAVAIATEQDLNIPLVYNSGGYDSVETLRLLDGIFDIYMPDAKYGSDDMALRLSDAPDYVSVNQAALREMHRQTGDLVISDGIAVRGLIIRHLVLPHGLAGTDTVMRFIADELSRDSYVNVMPQYRPCGRIFDDARESLYRDLQQPLRLSEFREAIRIAREHGLHRGFPG